MAQRSEQLRAASQKKKSQIEEVQSYGFYYFSTRVKLGALESFPVSLKKSVGDFCYELESPF